MPPRTRGSKLIKTAKENIDVVVKTKQIAVSKVNKQRKPLADKTNSASDDNASPIKPKRIIKESVKNTNVGKVTSVKKNLRRERKLPKRYNENEVLKNLSNNKDIGLPVSCHQVDDIKTPVKNDSVTSPFKTPQNVDNSLIANRPRRICRLPSKFDDHSISPNKFIPVGCHASTPIVPIKSAKVSKLETKPENVKQDNSTSVRTTKQIKKRPLKKLASSVNSPSPKKKDAVSSDTNNNANQHFLRDRKVRKEHLSPNKDTTEKLKSPPNKLLTANFSFRLLEEKKKISKRNSTHLDVYEFTYDPNDEPPPQKKKRKRVVKKKPPKPKMYVYKTNYDQNVSKALLALKNVVSKKGPPVENNKINQATDRHMQPTALISNPPITLGTPRPPEQTAGTDQNVLNSHPQVPSNTSTRVEDIAADFEVDLDHHDIDYSPVNSPERVKSPLPNAEAYPNIEFPAHNRDPLNLREDISFFDEPPVASSSINTSVRRPHASPWRVEFEQLPIKWHVNTYVKSNMTPAVESSFISFDDSKNKKKHVYTNLVPEPNVELPEIVNNTQQNLKQTSIISFIRNVIQKSATKKKRAKSITPMKANSNLHPTVPRDETPEKTPCKEKNNYWTPNKDTCGNLSQNISNEEDKENSDKIVQETSEKPGENKDGTYFGFDESEDVENVAPVKVDNRIRALRPRGRAVLQEINAVSGPSRAKMPLAVKTKIAASSVAANKVYEETKSATDAPVFLEENAVTPCIAATNVQQIYDQDLINDSESVHLFEDVDVVHHVKAVRKSYGKGKKVAFQQAATMDSELQVNIVEQNDSVSSDEDDLADLTFTMPNVEHKNKPKRKTKAKKKGEQSKKEKAEMEAWAAEFNSMCEDVEEFPLLVE